MAYGFFTFMLIGDLTILPTYGVGSVNEGCLRFCLLSPTGTMFEQLFIAVPQ